MKNVLKAFALLVMGILMTQCDSQKNYEKEVNAACDEGDFQKAYELLGEYKEASNEDYDYYELYHSTIKKEALFLISEDNEESTERLLYLIKENTPSGDVNFGSCDYFTNEDMDKFMDLALEKNNDKLIEALITSYIGKPTSGNYVNEFSDEQTNKINKMEEYCVKNKNFKLVSRLTELVKNGRDWDIIQDFSGDNPQKLVCTIIAINTTESNQYLKTIINQWGLYGWEFQNNAIKKVLGSAILYKNKDIAQYVMSKTKNSWDVYAEMKKEYDEALSSGALEDAQTEE